MAERPSMPERRGLNQAQAAAYVGLSSPTFSAWAKENDIKPLVLGRKRIWDRKVLDLALDSESGLPSNSSDELSRELAEWARS